MKIVIISGFLGAGKTSFIKAMAEKTKRQFVVVENEFGELGIDGKLLNENPASDDTQMKVWELTEGCICCSLNQDFAQSVMTIANTLNPDFLLVEPSGIALPGQILQQLSKISYERIQLGAPITIVDALHYQETRRSYPEYFDNQIYVAGTVVLSKSEQLSEAEFRRIHDDLGLSADVEFPEIHYSHWSQEMWLCMLQKEMKLEPGQDPARPQRSFRQGRLKKEKTPETYSLSSVNLHNVDEVERNLLLLLSGAFGTIIRSKGYCKVGQHWCRFDLVAPDYAITGCEPMQDERIVFIGHNLKKDALERLFCR
ncbi:MAG: CobW family GTP-binding protein [Lachnospiraceae bacterium]